MARPRSQGPTLATVAAATGVSVSTASKALHNDPTISAATRSRVQLTALDLGYPSPSARTSSGADGAAAAAPSPAATRAAAGLREQTFSVVFDTVDTNYAAEVLKGLLDEAQRLDVRLRIDHVGMPTDRMGARALDASLAVARRAMLGSAGLVMVTTGISEELSSQCRTLDIPLVAVDPATAVPSRTPSIGATNWRGGVQATEHLLGLGHRRIGVVRGPDKSQPACERLAGYRTALTSAGIVPDPALERHGRFDYESGLSHGTALLELPEPPTAVVCCCDPCAIGVIEAARRRGMRVPEDLSVVGFDDTLGARLSSPRLTTIRQPLTETGAEALRTVVALARHDRARALPLQLATSLVVRDSTAPPRSRRLLENPLTPPD